MELNDEEQAIYDKVKSGVDRHSAMDYYTSVSYFQGLGLDLPERYKEVCDTTPRFLIEYDAEAKLLKGYTEDGTLVLEGNLLSTFLRDIEEQFPGQILDNINDIPVDDEGTLSQNFLDSRFPSHTYRMELREHVGRVSDYLLVKSGEGSEIDDFDLVNCFFAYLWERRSKSRGELPEYDLQAVIPHSGYTKDGRAFVELPIFTEAMPLSTRGLEYLMVYGADMNDAYSNAAQHIVTHYDMNGNPND